MSSVFTNGGFFEKSTSRSDRGLVGGLRARLPVATARRQQGAGRGGREQALPAVRRSAPAAAQRLIAKNTRMLFEHLNFRLVPLP